MRYIECTVTPAEGYFHPVERAIAVHSDLTRETVLHGTALGDGTGVLLYQLRGPASALETALAENADVIAQDIHDGHSDVCHLYLHVRLNEPARIFLACVQRYALISVPPFACTAHGGLGLTLIGHHDNLWHALDDLPATIQLSIGQVSEYSLDQMGERTGSISGLSAPLSSLLTDRQAAVLQTAIDTGYYDLPRQTTHADIATKYDCSPSTIDEHLRKVEARVFPTLVP